VRSRMAKAADEMSHYAEYEYVVLNEDVARSVAQVEAIVTAERARRARQTGLHDFVESLKPVS
jgi:guanylate kinase